MLICHCRVVNDKAIRAAILSGAQSREDVAHACGAGSRCGGCHPALDALLAAHDRRQAEARRPQNTAA